MADLPAAALVDLLRRVQEGRDEAWREFLDRFAPLLLQAASRVERDVDHAADAFVYACEQLRARRCSRLAAYDVERPGSFEIWLRAVALNLARDARRHRMGRLRMVALVRRLPALDQRIFYFRHELGLTIDQTTAALSREFPGLTEKSVADTDERLAGRISPRQRFRRQARLAKVIAFDPHVHREPVDPAPDPEWQLLARESGQQLTAALQDLSDEERLLLLYRFERSLTLAAIAQLFGLANPQAVDRRLHALLTTLRAALCSDEGNPSRVSVRKG